MSKEADEEKAEPFIKWVGGKRSVLDAIIPAAPAEFGSYFEPFVGGGAVFFALASRAHGGTLGDINGELLTTYRVIRNEPDKLLSKLKVHEQKHYAWLRENKKALQKKLRSLQISEENYEALRRKKGAKLDSAIREFNKKKGASLTREKWEEQFPTRRITKEEKEKIYYYQIRQSTPRNDISIAARFLYLNRTCFNGLYRVNASGEFNVPMGDYTAPDIIREESIRRASRALNKIDSIKEGDFSEIKPSRGDFVYLDPPYDIIHSGTFTQYAEDDFDRFDQVRLRDFLKKLDSEGVLWMTSNHDTPFIRLLYRDYYIYQIEVGRSINSKGNQRGAVREVLVMNYKPPQEPTLQDGTVSLLGEKDIEEARGTLTQEIEEIDSSEEKLLALLGDIIKD